MYKFTLSCKHKIWMSKSFMFNKGTTHVANMNIFCTSQVARYNWEFYLSSFLFTKSILKWTSLSSWSGRQFERNKLIYNYNTCVPLVFQSGAKWSELFEHIATRQSATMLNAQPNKVLFYYTSYKRHGHQLSWQAFQSIISKLVRFNQDN